MMTPASGTAAMPKKKSAYTDQTQPPYFRLNAQQWYAYSDKASDKQKGRPQKI